MSMKTRLVVLGAARTGKTQLMSRFMGKDFSDTYIPTVVEEYFRKIYTIRKQTYQLDVLETAGMSCNSMNQTITLMTGDVYLIVYSITNAASFETAKELAHMAEESVQQRVSNNKHTGLKHWNCKKTLSPTIPVIIAGNKIDLDEDRQVLHDDVLDWIFDSKSQFQKTRLAHIEMSAKDLTSVQRLFEMVFSTAHLPIEMSPSMHRKVSTNTFFENTSKLQQQQQQHRHRNHHSPKFFHRKKAQHDASTAEDADINGSGESVFDESDSFYAFAVTCPNQRRPSEATELTQAIAKNTHGHYIPKEALLPFQKLKKTIFRATSSHI